MGKKSYEQPEICMIPLYASDVITSSPADSADNLGGILDAWEE